MRLTRCLSKVVIIITWLIILTCCGLVRAQGDCTNLSWFLEADVFPEFQADISGGDGQLRFLDWQVLLKNVVRLREPINACEMGIADCAPRSTLGDGLITTADSV